MVAKDEVLKLLRSTEIYRIERTTFTGDMDKFQKVIYAFPNDLSNCRKEGYLTLGTHDNGTLPGLGVDDTLMKKIVEIHSDSNIPPSSIMSVEKFEFDEGDLLAIEVSSALTPPVHYRGRTFICIGLRRDTAAKSGEGVLLERRTSYTVSSNAMPCFGSSLKDIGVQSVKQEYLPQIIDTDIPMTDNQSLQKQLVVIHLYGIASDCPINVTTTLFGKNASFFPHGRHVQYVYFAGENTGSKTLNERQIRDSLCSILPESESFVKDTIATACLTPVSILREQTVFSYPELALRELLMNARMHCDYQSNIPVRIYQFSNRIEIPNVGGLYGEARPENSPAVNDYRDLTIAEAMREMRYVSIFNRGIQHVRIMLRDNGNPEPVFNVSKVTAFEVMV